MLVDASKIPYLGTCSEILAAFFILARVHFLLETVWALYKNCVRQAPSMVLQCFAVKVHTTTTEQEDRLFQGPPL